MVNKLDLRYGNPAFLQGYWDRFKEYIEVHRLPHLEDVKQLSYQIDSIGELREVIVKTHLTHSNAFICNRNIIIGNGATHVLTALLHALDKPVYANPPFYPRFTDLSHLAQLHWIKNKYSTQIITNPNNPDGTITGTEESSTTIYDLSYNWPQYTKPICYNKDIMVFSLAKATGFASTRIGWAIIKDHELANKVQHYIEMSSSGISLEAQHTAIKVLQHQLHFDWTVFKFGQAALEKRWQILNNLKENLKDITILNNSGMFLWCKGKCPENIEVLKGTSFGMDSDEYFRLNLGCSEKDFEILCLILKQKP